VSDNINHPCNALNVQVNARDSFDKLAWDIEAVKEGNVVSDVQVWPGGSRELRLSQWKYVFRRVRRKDFSSTIALADGEEIRFGCGQGSWVDKPNPDCCSIKLAIAHALHACGAADVITEIYGDDRLLSPSQFTLVDLSFPMMFFSVDSQIDSRRSAYQHCGRVNRDRCIIRRARGYHRSCQYACAACCIGD